MADLDMLNTMDFCEVRSTHRNYAATELILLYLTGQILNFLLSLLLLLTLKQFNTKIKKTRLRYYLPLDGTLFLHKMAAIASFVIGAAHIVAQVTLIRKSPLDLHCHF